MIQFTRVVPKYTATEGGLEPAPYVVPTTEVLAKCVEKL